MPIISKSFDELNGDTVSRLTALGYTDAAYKGTAVRDIVEACDVHIAELYDAMRSNLQTQYISQAPDDVLDALGLLVGIQRRAGELGQNLRVRIANALLSSVGTNLTALLGSLLGLSAVRDVIVRPYTLGIGSLTFYLIGTNGIVDAGTIATAQSTVNSLAAAGAYTVITTPSPVLINLTGTIAVATGSQDQTGIAQAALRNLLSGLPMGGPLNLSKITETVLNSSTLITDFNLLTLSTVINGITREQLLANLVPAFDQQIQPGSIVIS